MAGPQQHHGQEMPAHQLLVPHRSNGPRKLVARVGTHQSPQVPHRFAVRFRQELLHLAFQILLISRIEKARHRRRADVLNCLAAVAGGGPFSAGWGLLEQPTTAGNVTARRNPNKHFFISILPGFPLPGAVARKGVLGRRGANMVLDETASFRQRTISRPKPCGGHATKKQQLIMSVSLPG